MKCFGIFYGGCSYSNMWANENVETFKSIAHAKDVFWTRTSTNHPYYPTIDETAEMMIFFNDPRTWDAKPCELIEDLYPDRIIKTGPRCGIICERC
ncbi:MAG: hypothetical protein KJ888_21030 [Gammaproteobacteria bacterium]|nr:hypothetical protein [Gammaproteobacteria bacterium]